MRQIIYFSTAKVVQTNHVIEGILKGARRWNDQAQITGLLVAGGDRYLQIIEGQSIPLDLTMNRIRNDPQHFRMDVLIDRKIVQRDFGDWSMAFRADSQLGRYASFNAMTDTLHDLIDPDLRHKIKLLAATFSTSALLPELPWAVGH